MHAAVALACLLVFAAVTAAVAEPSSGNSELCRPPAITRGAYCVCPAKTTCRGSACRLGQRDGVRIQGYPVTCATCSCRASTDARRRRGREVAAAAARPTDKKPRVLILSVATHREPFIDLLEQSMAEIGETLHIAGLGQQFLGEWAGG
jgi:hypothetical protein